jgi:hypothetical protein
MFLPHLGSSLASMTADPLARALTHVFRFYRLEALLIAGEGPFPLTGVPSWLRS